MIKEHKWAAALLAAGLLCGSSAWAQCADSSNIYSFTYNGSTYELVRQNKTWIDAAACAVERGGYLSEINDANEQNALFNEVINSGGITFSNTVAPDGGGGAYIWLGGNDLGTEGVWIWDGDNDQVGPQFWQGTTTGGPVGGLYNNWGNEPDDFAGQDALGMSLNGWPLGVAGQWNDVDHTNSLYFLVEIDGGIGMLEDGKTKFQIFPNPATDQLRLEWDREIGDVFVILDMGGRSVLRFEAELLSEMVISVTPLDPGLYFGILLKQNGEIHRQKFLVASP